MRTLMAASLPRLFFSRRFAFDQVEDARQVDAERISEFAGDVDFRTLVSVLDAGERADVHGSSLGKFLPREPLPNTLGLQGAVGAAS